VKENTRQKQIAVQHRVGCANRVGGAHHLASVAEKTSAMRVMVVAGSSSTLEALAELV
jgi:hypothetical protein